MRQPPKGDPGAYLTTILHSGETVIDGGANDGTVSEVCARLVGPTGRVVSIEPDTRCWAALTDRVERYPVIEPIAAALGAACVEVLFHIGRASVHSSCVHAAVADCLETQTVSCRTLDSLPVTSAAVVKLDLQGGEWDALRGASRLLTVCPQWVLEVWPRILRGQGVTAEAFWRRLTEAGLTVSWLTQPTLTPVSLEDFETWWTGTEQFVNVVAARE